MVEVFQRSWETGVDFGYQGEFERQYTDAFCRFQGGGYADAVATGTLAVFVALLAVDLPPRSDVIVSPVTDPGGVSPIILQGHTPVVADSKQGSFNIGIEEFEAALTPNTRCAILTHLGGIPVDLDPILALASDRGVVIIEDCSQAHGARYKGRRVGTFGHAAVFSTMFSKSHATGGCGGVVYTTDESIYWRCRALSDRGKSFHLDCYEPKDPNTSLYAALNLNLDEISCAIGLSTLAKLQATIDRRCEIVSEINEGLLQSRVVSPVAFPADCQVSPFFHTVQVSPSLISVPKRHFAEAVRAEGIGINPDYRFCVSEWGWVKPYLRPEASTTPNAVHFRDETFNVLFHERFAAEDVEDIIGSILKVERFYLA